MTVLVGTTCDGERSAVRWSFAASPEDIERCRRAGELTRQLADDEHVFWPAVNHVFLRPEGTIDTERMWDPFHQRGTARPGYRGPVDRTIPAVAACTGWLSGHSCSHVEC